MRPKKDREISELLCLVDSLNLTTRHALDLGAGRGHLSAALCDHGFKVISIDANAQFALPTPSDTAPSFQTTSLTADSITELLAAHPPSLVVGLHACGDLSPAILKGFLRNAASHEHTLVLVGCCYNLLSRYVPFPDLSSYHLQLAAQTPSSWSSNWSGFERSILKLAFRSRFAAELDGLSPRLGRLPDRHYVSYAHYRAAASAKAGVGPRLNLPRSAEEERSDLWKLSVAWTIRSLLGPVIESLIVLDRYLRMVEGLKACGGIPRRVELVNVFDQAEGRSPRNLAIVICPAT